MPTANFNYLFHINYNSKFIQFDPPEVSFTPVKRITTTQCNVLTSTTAHLATSSGIKTTSAVHASTSATNEPSSNIPVLLNYSSSITHYNIIVPIIFQENDFYYRYGGRPEIFSPVFCATLRAISEGRKVTYEERVDGRKVAVIVV